jgi:hypothetical protein
METRVGVCQRLVGMYACLVAPRCGRADTLPLARLEGLQAHVMGQLGPLNGLLDRYPHPRAGFRGRHVGDERSKGAKKETYRTLEERGYACMVIWSSGEYQTSPFTSEEA